MPSGSGVAMPSASPRTDPDQVDGAVAAPSRRNRAEGWIGQTARSDEFAWLAAEPAPERRASADSLVLPDEPVVAEASTKVESAPPPPPGVDEGVLTADAKRSAKFDVDFDACLLAEGKPPKVVRLASKPPEVESQPRSEVAEDQIRTSKVSTRNLDHCLAQSKIEFTSISVPDSEETVSLDEMEITSEESPATQAAPVKAEFEGPDVEEESIVRQSKQSAVVMPDFPADISASADAEDSPKAKKSGGGVFGFFKRKSPKNADRNGSAESPKGKSNSLDKKTAAKRQEVDEKSGAALPADIKKEKNSRFHVNFGFGGKNSRGSPSADEKSSKGQTSPRNNSSVESSKSPRKTNIRVFEIMAGKQNGADAGGGVKEQPAVTVSPSAVPEGPHVVQQLPPSADVSAPLASAATSQPPPRSSPVVDVHVAASSPVSPTVPAFSSQYMVAVAIDFGLCVAPLQGGSVAEWLACWTQAQQGPGSNRSQDAVG